MMNYIIQFRQHQFVSLSAVGSDGIGGGGKAVVTWKISV